MHCSVQEGEVTVSGYTDRGGAVLQKKDWEPLVLQQRTIFVHCGSAPFAQETTGLLLKYSKEICQVQATKDTKWILGFPMLDEGGNPIPPHSVPNEITLSKPCQLLWSKAEMPHGFVFQIPVGTTVYTKNKKLDPKNKVGFNFDIIFEDFLIAQYERKTTQMMRLVPLNGVNWL
jgi:hypothetical protein